MILITRPEPEASRLGRQLKDMGFYFLSQPMLTIRFLPVGSAFVSRVPVQALLATSANGVRALVRHGNRPSCPLLAIGPATAREARQAGLAPVWTASGWTESLLALASRHCRRHTGELLHVCGREISVNIAALLQRRGFSARRVILYEAVPTRHLASEVTNALQRRHIKAVLFFSRRTAQNWRRLIYAASLQEHCRDINAYCLARSAALAASELPFRRILTASQPDEAHLLELLVTTD